MRLPYEFVSHITLDSLRRVGGGGWKRRLEMASPIIYYGLCCSIDIGPPLYRLSNLLGNSLKNRNSEALYIALLSLFATEGTPLSLSRRRRRLLPDNDRRGSEKFN